MASFSTALKVTDLDDFITPSQACVIQQPAKPRVDPNKGFPVSAPSRGSIGYDGVPAPDPAPVKITLNDCLACSGCITSAETVLVQQQSVDEFLAQLSANAPGRITVVTISPQTRAALAVNFNLTPLQTLQKLTALFKQLGAHSVMDSSYSRDLALLEAREEFVQRFRSGDRTKVPMLASACPGWVCYAEKTHGDYVLPYISNTKSPQAVMGTLVKQVLAKQMGVGPEMIYHATVMPCFDKKLEASREDFQIDSAAGYERVREVDVVLTSIEILELLEKTGIDFMTLPDSPLDRIFSNVTEQNVLYGAPGGSSGGYLDCIMKYAARTLFGVDMPSVELKQLRNADMKEATLEVNGEVVLRFAAAYGFRNIQNIVRKIKTGKCPYHFVEIMACPSGCSNGGGQIRHKPPEGPKELLQRVEEAYSQYTPNVAEENLPAVELFKQWLGVPGSEQAQAALRTQYHAVEKPTDSSAALTIKW